MFDLLCHPSVDALSPSALAVPELPVQPVPPKAKPAQAKEQWR